MSGENENTEGAPESVEDLSDEQLDALLDETKVTEEGNLDESPLEFKTEEEEDADDGDEDDEDESEADAEEEGESDESDKDSEEEDSEEEDEEDEFAGLPDGTRDNLHKVLERLELIETENERLQADLDRANLLRDRAAGRAGSLKQRLERGDREADPDEFEDNEDDNDDAKRRSKSDSAGEEALAEIRAEKVERAIAGASQDFYVANQSFFEALEKQVSPEVNTKFQTDLLAKVREAQAELGENLLTMNPKIAAKVSDTLLRSAFADMKLSLISDLRKKARDESEESRRSIRDRKKGAAGTRSNKRSAARQNPKPKSVSQMTDKELDAALAEAAKLLE